MRGAMPSIDALLHESRFQRGWRCLLGLLAGITGWFALTPGVAGAPDPEGFDKFEHLLAFGSLALAAALAWPAGWRASLRASASLLAYGATVEVLQIWIPLRHADLHDLLADAIGIACGLLLAALLRLRWPRRGIEK
jgi:VanZ family protein